MYLYLAAGWSWYLVTMVPVIGLIQVGKQSMADRYTYITLTGLFIAGTWLMADLLSGFRIRSLLIGGLSILIITALMTSAALQVRHWRNSETIYRHTLAVTDDNWLIEYNYGPCLAQSGRMKEAVVHLAEAARISPLMAAVQNNLGNALLNLGKVGEALQHFKRAIYI